MKHLSLSGRSPIQVPDVIQGASVLAQVDGYAVAWDKAYPMKIGYYMPTAMQADVHP
ncbi:hypothetical protein [Suicoccus acidiformans]|uniref:hypothetical protein n=1 Tax=Suicoccus acidiformans TaxID=2036206 RepID=UPI0013C301F7|nr:hypothetical protein [Suicoccus acidiformans]